MSLDAVPQELSQSLEDYLEAIYVIIEEKTAARPKDIAVRMKVTNASVTGALRTLKDRGLVNHEPYDIVTLTDSGQRVAKVIDKKHKALKTFFTDVLAVGAKDAESIACKVEHAIPETVRNRLVCLRDYLSENTSIYWDETENSFAVRDD